LFPVSMFVRAWQTPFIDAPRISSGRRTGLAYPSRLCRQTFYRGLSLLQGLADR
jgi:hypothetical protein